MGLLNVCGLMILCWDRALNRLSIKGNTAIGEEGSYDFQREGVAMPEELLYNEHQVPFGDEERLKELDII